ncbi:MAG: helix-hairpin-helix domain-containing protein, partial [Candidatus Muiribacteriota bacterium]
NFCFAPCENDNRKTFYHNNIDEIIKILNGKNSEFIHMLNNEMKEKVENLDFEKAAYYRDILEAVKDFKQKQFVEIDNKNNFDVIGVSYNEQYICIVVNHYREGKFNSSEQFRFETIDTQDEICDFIFRYYERFCYRLKIFVSVELFENIYDIISLVNGKIVKSVKGQYASLVKLAEQNADKVLTDDLTFLISVKNKFNLENLPGRIECYDISNISGEFSVGVMTVFEMGQKAPHQYRKFKIKSVSGPDDFSSMREVIERRFSHKEWLYPDLVLVDGGKGQVSAVKEHIPDGIDLLGIAKKYEIILNKDFNEFFLNKDDRILKLMQNIRDETHRYAISFYRTKHGNFLKTGFEEIYGVGKKTVEKILKNYSSIDEMKNSGVDKLVKIVGKKQAEIIMKNINEKY